MAARKKGPPKPADDGGRAFAVVVEQLRGEFKVFGEALGGLRQEMNDGFAEVKRGLRQEMSDGFAEVKRDLRQEMSDGFAEVKRELVEIKVDLGLVKSAVTMHSGELKEIRRALGNKVERGEVEAIVEHVVARALAR